MYFLVYIIFYPFFKVFFRLKVDKSNYSPPKGAFIVLGNHASFFDFLTAMLTIYPRRLNAVTSQKYFFYNPLNIFLPMMGCIPKNLFDPDIRSIVGIKQVLNRGGGILMFPEGRCETDGEYMGIHKSTGKLIKKLGVPVVIAYSAGAFNCMPFWRPRLRLGRLNITISNLFSAEDLKAASVEEINSAIDSRLSGEGAMIPSIPLRAFCRKNLAFALDSILYLCPRCKSEFMLEAKGNYIRCTACQNKGEVGSDSKLRSVSDSDQSLSQSQKSIIPSTVHEWFAMQARHESEKLNNLETFVSTKVRVRLPSERRGKGMDSCGEGVVTLDRSGWRFVGEIKGDNADLFFPIDTVPALPFDPNDVFQIYSGKFYMFEPEEKKRSVQYSLIGECAYWKFASSVMMTPGKSSPFILNQR